MSLVEPMPGIAPPARPTKGRANGYIVSSSPRWVHLLVRDSIPHSFAELAALKRKALAGASALGSRSGLRAGFGGSTFGDAVAILEHLSGGTDEAHAAFSLGTLTGLASERADPLVE